MVLPQHLRAASDTESEVTNDLYSLGLKFINLLMPETQSKTFTKRSDIIAEMSYIDAALQEVGDLDDRAFIYDWVALTRHQIPESSNVIVMPSSTYTMTHDRIVDWLRDSTMFADSQLQFVNTAVKNTPPGTKRSPAYRVFRNPLLRE